MSITYKQFFILLFLAVTAWGQQERIAIIQTLDNHDSISPSDLVHLTNRLRETAVKILPKSRYVIMTQESIVAFLGSQELAAKICNEAGCLAEIGKKVNADYVAQARIGRFEKELSINFELYKTNNSALIGQFTGSHKKISGLLDIIDKKAPDLFKEMPGVADEAKATQQPLNDFLKRGITFAVRGDYEIAIEDFTEALKLQPNNGNIYALRGRTYVAKASKEVTSVADDFSEITVSAYGTLTPKQTEDYEQAISDFTKAIKLEPKNAVNYRENARVYDCKKNYDKAIADYSQAIRLDPNDAKAYSGRGEAYYNKGDQDKAIADFNQAIRLNPNYSEAYCNLGAVYYNKGDYDKAIAYLNQAIRLNPDYSKAYYGRGDSYLNKSDYNKGIADLNQAIRLDPNYAEAYHRRGEVYRIKGDYDKAIADYSQAIRLNPNYAGAYGGRGDAYRNKGDYDKGITDFNQAIRLDQNDAWVYNRRGMLYYNKGDYDKAIADFSQAIRLNPNNESARNNLEIARRAKMAR